MRFGKTVRKLREEKQISIAQLAKRVGMSPTYLAPIERDVFPPPRTKWSRLREHSTRTPMNSSRWQEESLPISIASSARILLRQHDS